jgi:hypothetical protein
MLLGMKESRNGGRRANGQQHEGGRRKVRLAKRSSCLENAQGGPGSAFGLVLDSPGVDAAS